MHSEGRKHVFSFAWNISPAVISLIRSYSFLSILSLSYLSVSLRVGISTRKKNWTEATNSVKLFIHNESFVNNFYSCTYTTHIRLVFI